MLGKTFLMTAIAATLGAASPVAAQATDPNDLTAAVRLAVDRGRMLYIYDRAGWIGTDDLRDRYPHLMSEVGGYVVTGDQSSTEIAFFDRQQSHAIYRATFSGGKLLGSGPPAADSVQLSPLEKRMIAAREKALQAFEQANVSLCSEAAANLTAIPSSEPAGPIIVYLMTPQTDLRSYPLGGHYSVEVSGAGTIGKVRRFTNSCIAMNSGQVKDGSSPVGFWITHILDPTPTEIHVFTSLASKMPIHVGTKNKRIWAVDGSTIRSNEAK